MHEDLGPRYYNVPIVLVFTPSLVFYCYNKINRYNWHEILTVVRMCLEDFYWFVKVICCISDTE